MGITHHATEDLGIMRMLPGMVVIAPADPLEAREATRAVVEYDGPCYLRLGKAGEPSVHKSPIQFRIGKAICARRGNDLTLISTGGMLLTALRAAERLAAQAGLEARVLSMHTLKPLDEDAIRIAARETRAIVTVEEHSVIGGLGSAVADVLAESLTRKVPFKKFGIPPMLPVDIGSQTYLLARYGLTDEAIANQLESWMESRPGSSRVLVERVGHS
jgi:transketolase